MTLREEVPEVMSLGQSFITYVGNVIGHGQSRNFKAQFCVENVTESKIFLECFSMHSALEILKPKKVLFAIWTL